MSADPTDPFHGLTPCVTPAEWFAHLPGIHQSGPNQWYAPCPSCGSTSRWALGISLGGRDFAFLMTCHAKARCRYVDVVEAMGFSMRDAEYRRQISPQPLAALATVTPIRQRWQDKQAAVQRTVFNRRPILSLTLEEFERRERENDWPATEQPGFDGPEFNGIVIHDVADEYWDEPQPQGEPPFVVRRVGNA